MKIKILKENQENTIAQRKRIMPRVDHSQERTSLDDFEDFEDSFEDPAVLEPLGDEEDDIESSVDPKLTMMVKKIVEQELRNPDVLRAIAELIKVR